MALNEEWRLYGSIGILQTVRRVLGIRSSVIQYGGLSTHPVWKKTMKSQATWEDQKNSVAVFTQRYSMSMHSCKSPHWQ